MQGSLRDKTARGVGWSFIDNIANSGITFLILNTKLGHRACNQIALFLMPDRNLSR